MTAYFAAVRRASTTRCQVAAFGTEYTRVTTADGGDLWLTKWGLPYQHQLLPEHWLHDGSCARHGERLGFSTGHVYKISVIAANRRLDFVAKISRLAQRIASHGLHWEANEQRTCFPSPFEEIGQLIALRESSAPANYLFTKRPLGILSPGKRVPTWMLDRVPHEFGMIARRHAADAASRGVPQTVYVEPDREYFTLFAWIEGFNLEQLVAMGRISRSELDVIDRQVRERLTQAGFAVADHKPDHVIVRLDSNGVPRRRNGRIVAALADFELLAAVSPQSATIGVSETPHSTVSSP